MRSKFLKLAGASLLMLLAFCASQPVKAAADCGITSGSIHDYAGATINVRAVTPAGASDTSANFGPSNIHVTTDNPSYSNGENVVNPNNDSDRVAGAEYDVHTIADSSNGSHCSPFTSASGLNHGAIMGRTNYSTDVNGRQWVLDCDNSKRVGQGKDPSHPYQSFSIFMHGNPYGMNGYWTASIYGTSVSVGSASSPLSQSNPLHIAPPNGDTWVIDLVFHEQAPPQTPPPTGSISCATNAVDMTIRFNWSDSSTGVRILEYVGGTKMGEVYSSSATQQGSTPLSITGLSTASPYPASRPVHGTQYTFIFVKKETPELDRVTCALKDPIGRVDCQVTSDANIHLTFSYAYVTGGSGVDLKAGSTSGPTLTHLNDSSSGSNTNSGTYDDAVAAGTTRNYYLVIGGTTTQLDTASCSTQAPQCTGCGCPGQPSCCTTCTCSGTCPPTMALSGNAGPGINDDEDPTSYSATGSFNSTSTNPSATYTCSWSVTQKTYNGAPTTIGSSSGTCSPGSVGGPSGSITGAQGGDEFCAYLTVSGTATNADGTTTSAGPSTFSGCETIKDLPIFKVFNSSITTGGNVGTCSGAVGALDGWYQDAYNDGAGAQLATYALAQIIGVGSNHTDKTRSATGLSFANTIGVAPGSNRSPYQGGKMGGQNCITPLAKPAAGAPTPTNGVEELGNRLTPSHGGSYSFGSSIKLQNSSNATVNADKQVGIYVAGDIYIKDDIMYTPSSLGAPWSIDSMPSLIVKASGNIYIDPGVTRLDGTYEAAGSIYTCGKIESPGVFKPVGQTDDIWTTCKNQLMVVGSFVANKINFLRTYGTLHNERDVRDSGGSCAHAGTASATRNTCAAEVFEFSPEQYLERPAALPNAAGATQYDAITSLPPVL